MNSAYPSTLTTPLEGKSLVFQIALFDQANVVTAQHGAALANLIWGRPGTKLIEIHPDDLPECLAERNFFLYLASCMGMGYRRVSQKSEHSAVDVDRLCSALMGTPQAIGLNTLS